MEWEALRTLLLVAAWTMNGIQSAQCWRRTELKRLWHAALSIFRVESTLANIKRVALSHCRTVIRIQHVRHETCHCHTHTQKKVKRQIGNDKRKKKRSILYWKSTYEGNTCACSLDVGFYRHNATQRKRQSVFGHTSDCDTQRTMLTTPERRKERFRKDDCRQYYTNIFESRIYIDTALMRDRPFGGREVERRCRFLVPAEHTLCVYAEDANGIYVCRRCAPLQNALSMPLNAMKSCENNLVSFKCY